MEMWNVLSLYRSGTLQSLNEHTNLKKLLVVGREKRSILQDDVKCVLHVRSEVKLETFLNSVLFCFTKGLVLRNTIQ